MCNTAVQHLVERCRLYISYISGMLRLIEHMPDWKLTALWVKQSPVIHDRGMKPDLCITECSPESHQSSLLIESQFAQLPSLHLCPLRYTLRYKVMNVFLQNRTLPGLYHSTFWDLTGHWFQPLVLQILLCPFYWVSSHNQLKVGLRSFLHSVSIRRWFQNPVLLMTGQSSPKFPS